MLAIFYLYKNYSHLSVCEELFNCKLDIFLMNNIVNNIFIYFIRKRVHSVFLFIFKTPMEEDANLNKFKMFFI